MNKINKKVGGKFLKNKKGQLTIFIILALAIALVLILLFVGRDNLFTLITGGDPVNQIRDCIKEPFENALEIVSLQGGSINPGNYYLYQDSKVDYLCYTADDYNKCFMQKPLLKQSIEKELEDYIKPFAQECINDISASLQGKGYLVSSKPIEVDVSLSPNNILLDVKTDLNLEKENKEFYDSIRMDFRSKLYEFVMISSSISNWEARYGGSETLLYMGYYPFLKVEKKKQSEGTTIYILSDRNSLDKFMFATRSVAIPVGLKFVQ